jgi:uncharacterized protein (DUF1697 family)
MPDNGFSTFIALLRGINVGGHKMVAMADLRRVFADLHFDGVQTLLQSGNVVFRAASRPAAELERLLEAETTRRLRVEADFVVRTAQELSRVVRRNPFEKEAHRDPGRLIVMFLKNAPNTGRVKALQSAIMGRETAQVDGRHAYVVYPDGMGRSRLTGAAIEKILGTRGTARNWNTVLKLLAAAKS